MLSDWSLTPEQNQRQGVINWSEGQTTSTVPASLRAMMQQMGFYATTNAPLAMEGKTEQLMLQYEDLDPREYLVTIPESTSTGEAFVFWQGNKIMQGIARNKIPAICTFVLPEAKLVWNAIRGSRAVPSGTVAYFKTTVPSGWNDVTDQMAGYFFCGGTDPAMEDFGKKRVGHNKDHNHTARVLNTTGIQTRSTVLHDMTGQVYGGNEYTASDNRSWRVPSHNHGATCENEGGNNKEPVGFPDFIQLKVGVKL